MLQTLAAALAQTTGLLAVAGMATCDNLDNFDIDVNAKATVPKGTVIDELLAALSFDALASIDLTQELENQGVTKDDVDSVRITAFTLTIEAPQGQTFDFLDSVAFSAETDGQPSVVVARIDPVPKGASTLELTVTGAELKPYVVAPKMRISATVKGTRPMQDTTVDAKVVLDVDAHVPGCG
jgi:hypothetical protein